MRRRPTNRIDSLHGLTARLRNTGLPLVKTQSARGPAIYTAAGVPVDPLVVAEALAAGQLIGEPDGLFGRATSQTFRLR